MAESSAYKEGVKLYKEATKLSNPSVLSFRFSAEWERATPLFEKAAQLFRVGRRVGGCRLFGAKRSCAARLSCLGTWTWRRAQML